MADGIHLENETIVISYYDDAEWVSRANQPSSIFKINFLKKQSCISDRFCNSMPNFVDNGQ